MRLHVMSLLTTAHWDLFPWHQVEKHTGPLPHSSDGSNDKIDVYRNHFTVLLQELKHIQIKADTIINRTNGWKKKKVAQMCTLFLFTNHDNNALRDFCVFSWTKQKRKAFDFIVYLSARFLQWANKKENQCLKNHCRSNWVSLINMS